MTTVQPTASNDEPAWFVGFDWGSEKHRVALFDRTGNLIGRRDVAHSAVAYGCCAPRKRGRSRLPSPSRQRTAPWSMR
jgi:hypothetical protein